MNAPLRPLLKAAPIALSAVLLAACGGSGSDSGDTSGTTGTSDSTTGTASFAVTDGPSDQVSNVFVTFDRIDIKPAEGEIESFPLDTAERIDLLALQGGNAASLIDNVEVPAGDYDWVRLYVVPGLPDSEVIEDGTNASFGLYVPGSQPPSQNPNQRFIQLSSPFTVPAGGHADFVIDVDLRKALVRRDAPPMVEPFYMIRPSLRIVDRVATGSISGTVDSALIDDEACIEDDEGNQANAVYLFSGTDADVGDVYVDASGEPIARDAEDNPVSTANVEMNEEGLYTYTLGFVEAGEYTVAFTCDAVADDAEADDDLTFTDGINVSVAAGEDEAVDF
ncbi:DUF4382 domain-containing protein [Ectothiorhodospiraceae bacterium WFHF3C12]|nr:DUF4382 domain-containing protein [Ectothiorhodospiraceae bacterium WFHF3C12]